MYRRIEFWFEGKPSDSCLCNRVIKLPLIWVSLKWLRKGEMLACTSYGEKIWMKISLQKGGSKCPYNLCSEHFRTKPSYCYLYQMYVKASLAWMGSKMFGTQVTWSYSHRKNFAIFCEIFLCLRKDPVALFLSTFEPNQAREAFQWH